MVSSRPTVPPIALAIVENTDATEPNTLPIVSPIAEIAPPRPVNSRNAETAVPTTSAARPRVSPIKEAICENAVVTIVATRLIVWPSNAAFSARTPIGVNDMIHSAVATCPSLRDLKMSTKPS